MGRERLGELIRRYRGKRSQSTVATLLQIQGLNFDQTAVSDVETGKRELEMGEAAVFAIVLGIPRDEMANGLTVEYEYARDLVAGSPKDQRVMSEMRKTLERRMKR